MRSEASGFVFEHARYAQRRSPSQAAVARILITLLYAAIGTLQGSGTFESPPPCAAFGGAGSASRLPAHPLQMSASTTK